MSTITNICLSWALFLFTVYAHAQQRVEGLVLDGDTKQRIGRVLVINSTTGANTFNNAKGEFSLPVKTGDVLIAQREEYKSDTVTYSNQQAIIFNLNKTSIYIEPVTVVARKSPEQILSERRIEYDRAYRLADPGSYFSVGPNGAGLSINAIYNLLSKEGRNARKLTAYFQKEYEENIIDLKFSKGLVTRITGLEGELLDNFMLRYRPSYDFAQAANEYQMIGYIKSKYDHFMIYPYFNPLPDLKDLKIDEQDD